MGTDTKQCEGCSEIHQELKHYPFQKTAGWCYYRDKPQPTLAALAVRWNLSLDFRNCGFALYSHKDTQTQGKVMYRVTK